MSLVPGALVDRLSFFLLLGGPPRFSLFPYTALFRSPPVPAGAPAAASAGGSSHDLGQPRGHEPADARSEEHTSELQSQSKLVCRLLLEKKKTMPDALAAPLNLPDTVTPTPCVAIATL